MAGYRRITFNGDPGSVWVNETGKVQFQFFCSWANSCGVCMQYDRAIGPWWPIPIHPNCRCTQKSIAVNGSAAPFVDFRAKLDALPDDQKVVAVGKANYALIKKGVVQYDDVVSRTRLRPFHEVVANKQLDVKTMVKAGVRKDIAEAAYAKVHTAEHEHAEAHRRELVQKLKGAGLNPSQISGAVAQKMPARFGIRGLDGGPTETFRTPTDADLLRTLLRRGLPAGPIIPTISAATKKKAPAQQPPPSHPDPNVAKAFDYAVAQGVPIEIATPDRITRDMGLPRLVVDTTPVFYRPLDQTIYINPSAALWADPDTQIAKDHKSGYWVPSTIEEMVDHEINHRNHHRAVGARRYNQLRGEAFPAEVSRRIKAEVSRRAAFNPLELVAEVGVGLKAGRTYGPEIMDLYRKYTSKPGTPRP